MECRSSHLVGNRAQLDEDHLANESHSPSNAGQGQAARTNPMSPALAGLATQIEQARACYQANRLYHGTTLDGKKRIQEIGFDTALKTGGATESAIVNGLWTAGRKDGKVETSTKYNYLCNMGTANVFAVLASMGSNSPSGPAVVRTIGVRQAVNSLEQDPDSVPNPAEMRENPNWRTPDKIPAAHVLNSKKLGKPTKEGTKIFHGLLDAAGVKVSQDVAESLLRDVQSDSEDDLPEEDVKGYTSFWNENIARKKAG